MKKLSDYDIFLNHVLGAHAIWEFAKYYQENSEGNKPPTILLTLPVLPIVFNKRATDCIKGRNFKEGSLFKTITENKDIYTGLQDRMEQTTDLSFKSIHLAVSSGLLIYDKETTELIPNKRSEPETKYHRDYQDILAASKRIGAWFGQLSFSEITQYFNIHY